MDIVREHFAARAERYDRSSHWVTDPILADQIVQAVAPKPTDTLLDVACGTGLVGKLFKDRVMRLVGVDFCPEMTAHAQSVYDELHNASAEALPLADNQFDISVCRQGLQFMDAARAVAEMVRVTKKSGRVCLVHLCAYGDKDQAEYAQILRLRNPARRNLFAREDFARLLSAAGCRQAAVRWHVSPEDVDIWSDHGAISQTAREQIREVYRRASPEFTRLHSVRQADGRLVDNMLFGIAVGVK